MKVCMGKTTYLNLLPDILVPSRIPLTELDKLSEHTARCKDRKGNKVLSCGLHRIET